MEQLKIGQVTASEEIVQEISEMEDFQVFCMSCVRRHRSGDWGDVPRDIWVDNNLSSGKAGGLSANTRSRRSSGSDMPTGSSLKRTRNGPKHGLCSRTTIDKN